MLSTYKSLLLIPLGQEHRTNRAKQDYVQEHLDDIEYRTLACVDVDADGPREVN
mgnify:CR=1